MITREADYAIRVVLCLARSAGEKGAVSTAYLAKEMDIPYRFLRKIVRRMVEAGLVRSQRGKGGGVVLARPSNAISLLDVLQAIDPRAVLLNRCLESGEPCNRQGTCPIHNQMRHLQSSLDRELSSVTFGQICAAPQAT